MYIETSSVTWKSFNPFKSAKKSKLNMSDVFTDITFYSPLGGDLSLSFGDIYAGLYILWVVNETV